MAPPSGGAFDFEHKIPDRLNSVCRKVDSPSQYLLQNGFEGDGILGRAGSNTAFEACVMSSPSVTAVTARDAFGVDLTFVQTYSQAQGDV
jgi:hypothetical protein